MDITNAAKKYILSLLDVHNIPLLRVFKDSSGCCGGSYALALGEKEQGEKITLINDVPVVIEESIQSEITHVILDYNVEKGLYFPNMTHSCNH